MRIIYYLQVAAKLFESFFEFSKAVSIGLTICFSQVCFVKQEPVGNDHYWRFQQQQFQWPYGFSATAQPIPSCFACSIKDFDLAAAATVSLCQAIRDLLCKGERDLLSYLLLGFVVDMAKIFPCLRHTISLS